MPRGGTCFAAAAAIRLPSLVVQVLLSCRTGEVDRSQAEEALASLGWLPRHENATFIEAKTATVFENLPEEVKTELEGSDPILVEVSSGVWGFCSLERQRALNFRLFHDRAEVLQEAALSLVLRFPVAFNEARRVEAEFVSPALMSKPDTGEIVGRGVVFHRQRRGFVSFVKRERRRESCLIGWLGALYLVYEVTSAGFYLHGDTRIDLYIRGWFDRGATSLAAGLLTVLIGLSFEYREWRNLEACIEWTSA